MNVYKNLSISVGPTEVNYLAGAHLTMIKYLPLLDHAVPVIPLLCTLDEIYVRLCSKLI